MLNTVSNQKRSSYVETALIWNNDTLQYNRKLYDSLVVHCMCRFSIEYGKNNIVSSGMVIKYTITVQ